MYPVGIVINRKGFCGRVPGSKALESGIFRRKNKEFTAIGSACNPATLQAGSKDRASQERVLSLDGWRENNGLDATSSMV
jgi:hypothetical protein